LVLRLGSLLGLRKWRVVSGPDPVGVNEWRVTIHRRFGGVWGGLGLWLRLAGRLGLLGGAGLKAGATGSGREAVVEVVVDGVADGFAPAVATEGLTILVLGDVDGLEENLRHIGDGAGDSGFYIAADHGGDEVSEGSAEIAGGEVVAGEEVGQVLAEGFGSLGASFFLGVVGAEAFMVAVARGEATAAIRECEGTQGHAVLGTESGHRSLLRVKFWDCGSKAGRAEARPYTEKSTGGNLRHQQERTPAGCQRYKHGPKTETPRVSRGTVSYGDIVPQR
jgi:hypothetical protein